MISEAGHFRLDAAELGRVPILVAEADAAQSVRLCRCLTLLGHRPELATSSHGVLEMVRRHIFAEALVAVELTWQGQPVLARLRRLPSVKSLLAIGPDNDMEAETLARLAGADAYLPRPVTVESLAKALWLPTSRRLA